MLPKQFNLEDESTKGARGSPKKAAQNDKTVPDTFTDILFAPVTHYKSLSITN